MTAYILPTVDVLAAGIESFLKRSTIPATLPGTEPIGVTPHTLAQFVIDMITIGASQPYPEPPVGLCGNRDDHEPHLVESAAVAGGGPFWCHADQSKRLPYVLERKDN